MPGKKEYFTGDTQKFSTIIQCAHTAFWLWNTSSLFLFCDIPLKGLSWYFTAEWHYLPLYHVHKSLLLRCSLPNWPWSLGKYQNSNRGKNTLCKHRFTIYSHKMWDLNLTVNESKYLTFTLLWFNCKNAFMKHCRLCCNITYVLYFFFTVV